MQSDLRFDESDPKHKTDRTATALGSILARRDQAPDATAAEEAAKKFGRTLGVWIKDPDLMRNLAEKAGVAGFLPKQAQKTENAAAVMGNELSLAEVFTRMQGVDRPDALGTEMRPMIVSVKEMQGGEA